MKRLILLAVAASLALTAQYRGPEPQDPRMRRMPDGRTQAEHILKSEYEKNLKDAAKLIKLAEELKAEIEKNDYHVLSLDAIRKAQDVEKLAKKIKGRLKHR